MWQTWQELQELVKDIKEWCELIESLCLNGGLKVEEANVLVSRLCLLLGRGHEVK